MKNAIGTSLNSGSSSTTIAPFRIDITRSGTPRDVLSITKQLEAAPSEDERPITESTIDGERPGAYDVVVTVDNESPETDRWPVADDCDGLYIRVLPDEGVLVSGRQRD